MKAIEIMKANREKYNNLAESKEEELLKLKGDADKCLQAKDFFWLEVNLKKMLECNREIMKHKETAMMWETSIIILKKELNAENPEK